MRLLSATPYTLVEQPPQDRLHPEKGHLSLTKIIRSLGVELGHLKAYAERPGPPSVHAEMGYCWEEALEEQLGRRQRDLEGRDAQQKRCVDDIHVKCDAIWMERSRLKPGVASRVVDECKLTYSAPPKDPARMLEEHWDWKMQTLSYAHVYEARVVRLLVCWAKYIPAPVEYRWQFEDAEVARAWSMVLRHRDKMVKEGRRK